VHQIITDRQPSIAVKPISRADWDLFLPSDDGPSTFEIRLNMCLYGRDKAPWTWRFDDSTAMITVTFRSLQISATSISSHTLRGECWSPISDFRVSPNGDQMTLTFRPERRCPVLIRTGDDIEVHSMFFLGLFALHIEARDWFIRWMTAAAQQTLGHFLIDQGLEDAPIGSRGRSTNRWIPCRPSSCVG
jgi:hypothetical protein